MSARAARIRPLRLGRPPESADGAVRLLAGVARALATALGPPLRADVHAGFLDPRLIEAPAVSGLLEACVVLGWSADGGELAVVVDVASAQACAAAALGSADPPRGGDGLSPLEREVLGRVVGLAVPALGPLCGRIHGEAQVRPAAGDLFVEFTIGPAPAATLGVALRPGAPAPSSQPMEVDSLAEVPMTLSVEFARGRLTLAELSALAPGDVIVFDTRIGAPAVLSVSGEPAFAGEPGACGMRAAFAVRETRT